MSDERRHDVTAVALLLVIEAVLFAQIITGAGVFFFRDFSRYYFPVKKMQREIVLAGEFPWWTRAYGAGQPLAANPEHETFYPLNWLILLPDYVGALHMQALLHVAIGLLAMYAFLRSLKLRAFASFVGALSFGLGGTMLSKINMAPFLYSYAWLPLTCLYAREFLNDGKRRSFALAVLFLAIQMLIGEPTTVIQTLLIIAFMTGARLTDLMRAAAIGIGAFLLAAVQMIPALDFVRDSARARPFPLKTVGQWSMPPIKLLELVFPNILGHNFLEDTTLFWGGRLYGLSGVPFLLSIYPGLLIAGLAIAGIVARRRWWGAAAGMCAVAVVIALGNHTPLLGIFYRVGIANALRYPEKFIVIAIFAITVFAAHCVEALQDGDETLRRRAIWVAAILTAIPLAMYVWALSPGYATRLAGFFGIADEHLSIAASVSRFDWLVATVRGGALLALVLTARKAMRPLWMVAAATMLLVDLHKLPAEVSPSFPPNVYERPNLPGAIWDPQYRLFHQTEFVPNVTAPPGTRLVKVMPQAIRMRDVARIEYGYRNALFPMFSVAWGLPLVLEPDVDATNLLPTFDFKRAVENAAGAGGDRAIASAMAMSNARFRAVYRSTLPDASQDPEHVQPVAFVEMTRQPRYYFGSPVIATRNVEDFTAKLASGAYPPSVAFVGQPLQVNGGGVVHSVVESSSAATIDVEANGRALLVMSVTPHRYWRVFVDGMRATPIVTNVGYQGVIVPSGRHRVSMSYRNPVVIASVFVSLAAAITLIFLVIYDTRNNHS